MDSLPVSAEGGNADRPYDLPEEPSELPVAEELYDLPEPEESVDYELVLLNDDMHTFEYVMALLRDVFGVPWDNGFWVAKTIDHKGRKVVFTGTWQEVARKHDEVLAYGPDPRLPFSIGPLKVEINESARG